MAFADHFSEQSARYATFRPTYPASLIAWIAGLAPARDRAWDCATGNGQAAVLLAEHFDEVVATDASAQQLSAATAHLRVRYWVATERASGLAKAAVSLVTVAQALHWFNLPAFFAEVDRVLRPDGVLAVWSYGKPSIEGDANAALHWFHDERVGPFWPSERFDVIDGYRTLALPYPEIETEPQTLSVQMTRDALIGYVGTWSAVRQARMREGRDPMTGFEARLGAVWTERAEERTVSWPLTVRACRRGAD